MKRALFTGLIFDENDNPVENVYIGQDSCYVIDDHGFKKHILSETIDRQVLDQMRSMIEGNEEMISQQTAKMLGQDDIFTYAMIANQLKNMDEQFDKLLESGIPNEAKSYMGLMGFKIIINVHGEVVRVNQPGIEPGHDEE
jgi:chlorite dismutase